MYEEEKSVRSSDKCKSEERSPAKLKTEPTQSATATEVAHRKNERDRYPQAAKRRGRTKQAIEDVQGIISMKEKKRAAEKAAR